MANKKQETSSKAKPVAKAKRGASGPQPAARKGMRKEWFIGLAFLLIVAAVGAQVVFMAKKRGAEKLEFQRVGALVQKGAAEGQCGGARAMAAAKDGGFYHLDGDAPHWRLQRFGRDGAFLGRYKPANDNGVLARPHFMVTGEDGSVYVLDRDGRVVVLTADLKQRQVVSIPVTDAIGIAVNTAGELLVLNPAQQRVEVLSPDGKPLRYIGDGAEPKGALTAPLALALGKPGDELYVLEAPGGKARIRVFNAEGGYERAFFVQVKITPYSSFGVDPQGRLYFSQLDSGTGVVVYDKKGKFIGMAKSSVDNQMFPDQGYLTVNPWSGDLILNYAPAVGFFRYQPEAQ